MGVTYPPLPPRAPFSATGFHCSIIFARPVQHVIQLDLIGPDDRVGGKVAIRLCAIEILGLLYGELGDTRRKKRTSSRLKVQTPSSLSLRLVPAWARVLLNGLGLAEWVAVVDADDRVRIWCTREFIRVLEALGTMEGDLQDADGLVYRVASKHLRDLNGEDIRLVHHWSQVGMDLLLDKAFQSGNEVNVKAEHIATNRLANIVKCRTSQEADLHTFNHDLRVDFVLDLTGGEIGGVVGREAEFPVHEHGIVIGLGISLDMLKPRRFGTKSEELHAHATARLWYRALLGLRHFALDVVAEVAAHPANGSTVVSSAGCHYDEHPTQSSAQHSHNPRSKRSKDDDPGVVIPITKEFLVQFSFKKVLSVHHPDQRRVRPSGASYAASRTAASTIILSVSVLYRTSPSLLPCLPLAAHLLFSFLRIHRGVWVVGGFHSTLLLELRGPASANVGYLCWEQSGAQLNGDQVANGQANASLAADQSSDRIRRSREGCREGKKVKMRGAVMVQVAGALSWRLTTEPAVSLLRAFSSLGRNQSEPVVTGRKPTQHDSEPAFQVAVPALALRAVDPRVLPAAPTITRPYRATLWRNPDKDWGAWTTIGAADGTRHLGPPAREVPPSLHYHYIQHGRLHLPRVQIDPLRQKLPRNSASSHNKSKGHDCQRRN
ncbi:hypothetical protein KC338_g301 [Hortaea werneckii]|nr:hypothetical protein KC338_g301 [Hortaea werneckii]